VKVKCNKCDADILPQTYDRNGGLCAWCKKEEIADDPRMRDSKGVHELKVKCSECDLDIPPQTYERNGGLCTLCMIRRDRRESRRVTSHMPWVQRPPEPLRRDSIGSASKWWRDTQLLSAKEFGRALKRRQKEESERDRRSHVYCDTCWCRTSGARFYDPGEALGDQQFWITMLRSEIRDLQLIDSSGETWFESRFLRIIAKRKDWIVCTSCARSLACKGELREGESAYQHACGKRGSVSKAELKRRYALGRENVLAAWSLVYGNPPPTLSETYGAATSIGQRLRRAVRVIRTREERRRKEVAAGLRCERCHQKPHYWRPWYFTKERLTDSASGREVCHRCGAFYCLDCTLKLQTRLLSEEERAVSGFNGNAYQRVMVCPLCRGAVLNEFASIVGFR